MIEKVTVMMADDNQNNIKILVSVMRFWHSIAFRFTLIRQNFQNCNETHRVFKTNMDILNADLKNSKKNGNIKIVLLLSNLFIPYTLNSNHPIKLPPRFEKIKIRRIRKHTILQNFFGIDCTLVCLESWKFVTQAT